MGFASNLHSLIINIMSKIENNNPIAVLMATYNGERYIQEQIDSILYQTNQDWTLYIQDDGSTDNTLKIIKNYNDPRIILMETGLTKQGAAMNFMSLLNLVESDYYMFCDQDDVWFSGKIEKEFNRIKEIENTVEVGTPIIVHTDRVHVDACLNIKLKSEFNPRNICLGRLMEKLEKLKNPNILAIYTIVGGCTMLFNKAVKELAFPFINVRVHDSICTMAVANVGGIIDTILEPTMYYRLHSNNTCGVSDKRLLPKFFHLGSIIKKNMKGFYIWKIYGRGSFFKFLYYRMKCFFILRTY